MSLVYERSGIEPSYVKPDHKFTVKLGGILVRPGLYRDGRAGAEYANQVAARSEEAGCLFCEPRLSEQTISRRGKYFTAFAASHPYEFFGDYRARSGGHELVVPTRHTDTPSGVGRRAAGEIAEYLRYREDEHTAMTFVRNQGNPSKSVPHLHYHSLAMDPSQRVAEQTYAWQGGVTRLAFEPVVTIDETADTLDAGEVVKKEEHFTVIRPDAPFVHFDGQEVQEHWRIQLPDARDAAAMAALRNHLAELEATTPPDQRFQTYTSPALAGQPASHIEVMHLGLNPVYKLKFDREQGITELVFAKLPLKTVIALNAMRQRR